MAFNCFIMFLLCLHKITCFRVFKFCRIETKVISEKKTGPITKQTTMYKTSEVGPGSLKAFGNGLRNAKQLLVKCFHRIPCSRAIQFCRNEAEEIN